MATPISTSYSKTLHIIRNPDGFSEGMVRQARYDAADTIERLERELADEKAEALRIHHEKVDHYEARLKAERDLATAKKALLVAKANFDTIHDRHVDEQDCDQDAGGDRTPNRDMNTVVDCTVAIGEINRALS